MVESLDRLHFRGRKPVLHGRCVVDGLEHISPAIFRQQVDRLACRLFELVIPPALEGNRRALQVRHEAFQAAEIVVQRSPGKRLPLFSRFRKLLDQLFHEAQNAQVGIQERSGQIGLCVKLIARRDGISRQRLQTGQGRTAGCCLHGQVTGAQRRRGEVG